MYHRLTLGLLTIVLLLSGCAGNTVEPVAPDPLVSQHPTWPPALGSVPLLQPVATTDDERLDVAVVVFDPGIPEDAASHSRLGIFPEIRRAEARYMPALLRDVLVAADAWGVVRVLPEGDASAELQVQGKILHSDGKQLVLSVQALDASGRLWLDRIYVDEALERDYPVPEGKDPFSDLYHQVANDLLRQRQQYAAEGGNLQQLRQLSTLRYAASLSPEAFRDYLGQGPEGNYLAVRLPAADDPMLERVERIRNQEYLFIDTVDEQYLKLFAEMRPTYNLWRQYGLEQAIYIVDYQQRLAQRDSQGRRGSFAAMQQTYNAFKWSKIQQQDLRELAKGFNNEVLPTVLEVSGKVFRLNGSLDGQYTEWRRILREIFILETGLPPVADLPPT